MDELGPRALPRLTYAVAEPVVSAIAGHIGCFPIASPRCAALPRPATAQDPTQKWQTVPDSDTVGVRASAGDGEVRISPPQTSRPSATTRRARDNSDRLSTFSRTIDRNYRSILKDFKVIGTMDPQFMLQITCVVRYRSQKCLSFSKRENQ
jgi:hypothetical protein